jgi:endoglucanase
LRTSLLYARTGISRLFFYEAYDDNANIATQYSSSGLLNGDMSRRPAADYLYQTNKLFGTFIYQKTLNSDPIVDNYQTSDGKNMYMLVVPDQKGRTATYSLDLNGADSAYVYNPKAGANDMTVNKVKLTNGKLSVSVTETPTFVTPSGLGSPVVLAPKTLLASAVVPDATLNSVTLYPNPTTSNVTVAFTNTIQGPLTIKISDINSNKTYKSYAYTKSGNSFSATIDISTLPKAIYIVQVLQGDQSIMRKEIKSN